MLLDQPATLVTRCATATAVYSYCFESPQSSQQHRRAATATLRRRKNALSTPPLHSSSLLLQAQIAAVRRTLLLAQKKRHGAASPNTAADIILPLNRGTPAALPSLACLTQLQSLHIHAVWKQGIQPKFALNS